VRVSFYLSFLNGSITPLPVIPECFYQESILFRIKASGFPIKNLGNDEKRSSPRENFTSSFPRPRRERVRVRVILLKKSFSSATSPLPYPPCQIVDLAGNPGTPSLQGREKKNAGDSVSPLP